MIKKIIIVLILVIGTFYLEVVNDHEDGLLNSLPTIVTSDKLKIEKEIADIDKLYIYGNHLNMEGSIALNDSINEKKVKFAGLDITFPKLEIDKIQLVLYNKKEILYNLIYTINEENITFKTSDKINTGIYLDGFKIKDYFAFLYVTFKEGKGQYYALNNLTDYPKTEYYPILNKYKIVVDSSNDYETIAFNINKSDSEAIYDIIIDPGHGGYDPGACYRRISPCETDYTIKYSKALKEKLESYGLKVALSWTEVKSSELVNEYGKTGRTAIGYNLKAKFIFSLHLNSGFDYSLTGLEIYTPNPIDYTFSKSLAESIKKTANIKYSSNLESKVADGVYTRTFTTYDINKYNKERKKDGYKPYTNITTKTPYYYMIRETGGIITRPYVDGDNKKKAENLYRFSNVGAESYILELGYIQSKEDINNFNTKQDLYIEGIANAIVEHLKIK
ncbi:MAG: N-acetylmuramoyl-L-alanine amidase [Bacilli bacterium]|nr:N-acetylmuramoyl-L-alanine amidase [Bacilli bacterium]MDD4808808.1 N-acetylmuramoyl-L-alanine amidase [Bacilli bacterium]